jgi:hypothetical protein
MSISGPVTVDLKENSTAAVAFDLMKFLGNAGSTRDDRANREYWLTLYRQCYKAASGYTLESILGED